MALPQQNITGGNNQKSTGITGWFKETGNQFKEKISQIPATSNAGKVVSTIKTSDTAKAIKTGGEMIKKSFTPIQRPATFDKRTPLPSTLETGEPIYSQKDYVKFSNITDPRQFPVGTQISHTGKVTLPKYGGFFQDSKLLTDKEIYDKKYLTDKKGGVIANPNYVEIGPKDIPAALEFEFKKEGAADDLVQLKKQRENLKKEPKKEKVTFLDALKYTQQSPELVGKAPTTALKAPTYQTIDRDFWQNSKIDAIIKDLEASAAGEKQGFVSSLGESVTKKPETLLNLAAVAAPEAMPAISAIVSGISASRDIATALEMNTIFEKEKRGEQLSKSEFITKWQFISDHRKNRTFMGEIGETIPDLAVYMNDLAVGGAVIQSKVFQKTFLNQSEKLIPSLVSGGVQNILNPAAISRVVEANLAPEYQIVRLEDGSNISALMKDDKGFIEATSTALAKQFVSGMTERIGEFAGPLIKGTSAKYFKQTIPEQVLLERFGDKVVAQKYLKQAILTRVLKDNIRKAGSLSAGLEAFQKITHWDGIIPELIEEETEEPLQAYLDERRYNNPITTEEGRRRLAQEAITIALWDSFLNSPQHYESMKNLAQSISIDKSGKVQVGALMGMPEGEEAPDSKLIQEAKKYNSAEEFVKAKGTPVYHGTSSEFEIPDLAHAKANGQFGKGIYLGEGEVPTAGSKYGTATKEFVLSPEANIRKLIGKEYSTTPAFQGRKEAMLEIIDIYKKNTGTDLSKALGIPELTASKVRSVKSGNARAMETFMSQNNNKIVQEAKQMWSEELKKKGIQGVNDRGTIVLFEDGLLKPKSQLIDIWNKANKQPTAIPETQAPMDYAQAKTILDEAAKKKGKKEGLSEVSPTETEQKLPGHKMFPESKEQTYDEFLLEQNQYAKQKIEGKRLQALKENYHRLKTVAEAKDVIAKDAKKDIPLKTKETVKDILDVSKIVNESTDPVDTALQLQLENSKVSEEQKKNAREAFAEKQQYKDTVNLISSDIVDRLVSLAEGDLLNAEKELNGQVTAEEYEAAINALNQRIAITKGKKQEDAKKALSYYLQYANLFRRFELFAPELYYKLKNAENNSDLIQDEDLKKLAVLNKRIGLFKRKNPYSKYGPESQRILRIADERGTVDDFNKMTKEDWEVLKLLNKFLLEWYPKVKEAAERQGRTMGYIDVYVPRKADFIPQPISDPSKAGGRGVEKFFSSIMKRTLGEAAPRELGVFQTLALYSYSASRYTEFSKIEKEIKKTLEAMPEWKYNLSKPYVDEIYSPVPAGWYKKFNAIVTRAEAVGLLGLGTAVKNVIYGTGSIAFGSDPITFGLALKEVSKKLSTEEGRAFYDKKNFVRQVKKQLRGDENIGTTFAGPAIRGSATAYETFTDWAMSPQAAGEYFLRRFAYEAGIIQGEKKGLTGDDLEIYAMKFVRDTQPAGGSSLEALPITKSYRLKFKDGKYETSFDFQLPSWLFQFVSTRVKAQEFMARRVISKTIEGFKQNSVKGMFNLVTMTAYLMAIGWTEKEIAQFLFDKIFGPVIKISAKGYKTVESQLKGEEIFGIPDALNEFTDPFDLRYVKMSWDMNKNDNYLVRGISALGQVWAGYTPPFLQHLAHLAGVRLPRDYIYNNWGDDGIKTQGEIMADDFEKAQPLSRMWQDITSIINRGRTLDRRKEDEVKTAEEWLSMPQDKAQSEYEKLKKTDKNKANSIKRIYENGVTESNPKLEKYRKLGVDNWERAEKIYEEFMKLPEEEGTQFYQDLIDLNIITKDVDKQIGALLEE